MKNEKLFFTLSWIKELQINSLSSTKKLKAACKIRSKKQEELEIYFI